MPWHRAGPPKRRRAALDPESIVTNREPGRPPPHVGAGLWLAVAALVVGCQPPQDSSAVLTEEPACSTASGAAPGNGAELCGFGDASAAETAVAASGGPSEETSAVAESTVERATGVRVSSDSAAIAALDSACQTGSAPACRELAGRLRDGTGVARDGARAADLFTATCERGDGDSCTELGRMHRMGTGVTCDDRLALPLYQRGCELGSAMGCHNAGVLLRGGQGVEAEPALATSLFSQACAGGYWVGCEAHGRQVLAEPGSDRADAEASFRRGCDQGGEALACIALAEALEAAGDLPGAARRFRTACNEGDLEACVGIASLMTDGRGVEQDQVAARQLLDLACRQRVAEGCVVLARIYAEGDGVDVDPAYAMSLRRRACEAGHEAACGALPASEPIR